MFQQLILIGNLGNDVEMRFTPTGVPVASFRMATSRTWTDAQGQPQKKTIWFDVTAWRKLAELLPQYIRKGSQIFLIGEIEEPNTYTDRDGNQRASLKVTAQTIKFLDRLGANGAPVEATDKGPAAGNSSGTELREEDIPF